MNTSRLRARAEAELQRAADHFLPSSSDSEPASDADAPAPAGAPGPPSAGGERRPSARRLEPTKRKRKKDKCALRQECRPCKKCVVRWCRVLEACCLLQACLYCCARGRPPSLESAGRPRQPPRHVQAAVCVLGHRRGGQWCPASVLQRRRDRERGKSKRSHRADGDRERRPAKRARTDAEKEAEAERRAAAAGGLARRAAPGQWAVPGTEPDAYFDSRGDRDNVLFQVRVLFCVPFQRCWRDNRGYQKCQKLTSLGSLSLHLGARAAGGQRPAGPAWAPASGSRPHTTACGREPHVCIMLRARGTRCQISAF